ncbi:MAG: hypothetical protein GY820_31165 [Gammaproteobacteria bacterium]|nr:hypothetical protein [Gammaproteobacteria bacterium]
MGRCEREGKRGGGGQTGGGGGGGGGFRFFSLPYVRLVGLSFNFSAKKSRIFLERVKKCFFGIKNVAADQNWSVGGGFRFFFLPLRQIGWIILQFQR